LLREREVATDAAVIDGGLHGFGHVDAFALL
jgi:hypothetical protein